MNHISIDLETLGTNPDCMIVSIGACEFDLETGEIGRSLYIPVDLDGQEDRSFSPSTLKWWMAQSTIAREVFNEEEARPLNVALYLLEQWSQNWDKKQVWGNGATFDISILENAYQFQQPWKFWNVRDMRTLVDVATTTSGFNKKLVDRMGVHHNALDDAIFQARVMCKAYEHIQLKGYIPQPIIATAEDEDISISNLK